MQRLYERHKAVTYPRTDSRYLTADLVATLPERVKACRVGAYAPVCGRILRSPIKAGPSFVDDAKVSDHHAIIPTEQGILPNSLEYGERKIYELVVARFLSALLPPCEYLQVEAEAVCGGERFAAKGKAIVQKGWQEIRELQKDRPLTEEEDPKGSPYGEEEESGNMPEFSKGQAVRFDGGKVTAGKTKPPAPFTEATLLAAMENPARYMEGADQGLKKTLGETGGLGTVATRADIIEKLLGSFMIEKKGQYIHLTPKGRQTLELAPKGLTSPELTARWEQKLADIAKGRARKADFEAEIRHYAADIVSDIKASSKTYRHENLTRKKCPECGKLMLEVNHKNGKMLVCQDRECGFRKVLSRATNARCPQCHKKMELSGDGESRFFSCACGYREKLSAFEKRKKESGGGVSKKEVSRYMDKMKKEAKEPMNQAFADAFAKLGL